MIFLDKFSLNLIALTGITKSKSGFGLNFFNNPSLTEPPTKALPGGKSAMDIGQSFGFKSPKTSFDSNVCLIIKLTPKLSLNSYVHMC